jgi:hypothetical protein
LVDSDEDWDAEDLEEEVLDGSSTMKADRAPDELETQREGPALTSRGPMPNSSSPKSAASKGEDSYSKDQDDFDVSDDDGDGLGGLMDFGDSKAISGIGMSGSGVNSGNSSSSLSNSSHGYDRAHNNTTTMTSGGGVAGDSSLHSLDEEASNTTETSVGPLGRAQAAAQAPAAAVLSAALADDSNSNDKDDDNGDAQSLRSPVNGTVQSGASSPSKAAALALGLDDDDNDDNAHGGGGSTGSDDGKANNADEDSLAWMTAGRGDRVGRGLGRSRGSAASANSGNNTEKKS